MKYFMKGIPLTSLAFTLILWLAIPWPAPVMASDTEGGYGGIPWAWGRNTSGQLGDGSTTSRPAPIQVSDLNDATALAGGEYFSLALKSDGTVWAWGEGANGQLGNGSPYDQYTPVQVSVLSGVHAIAAGDSHSLALKSDGTLRAWGYNAYGQLGDGTTISRSTPVPVSDLTGIIAIAGGGLYTSYTSHSLALNANGTVWAWGKNHTGQLGDGTTTERHTPVQVSDLYSVTAISAGILHSLALKSNGTVWAWGNNSQGRLGDGTTTHHYTPVQVSDLTQIIAIAGGGNHSLALKSGGTVWAWGYNKFGQLGDGTTADRYTPVQVSDLTNIVAIACGQYHSLALQSNGTVWAWGYNVYGQLGDGTTTHCDTPVRVSDLTGIIAVAGGHNHSMAVKEQPAAEKPDLVITDVWNEAGDICYQIRNIGDGTAPKGHHTRLLIDDEEVAEDLIDTELEPEARVRGCLEQAWQASRQEHQIGVCADGRGAISESDEQNNCREETWKSDVTPPGITSGPVVSEITRTSAMISWGTDEDSDSVVKYGQKAGLYNLEAKDVNLVKEHVISLTELQASSVYNYVVMSTDAAGNTAVGAAGFFETEALSDSKFPEISELNIVRKDSAVLCYEISAAVSDDIAIGRVEFYLDGRFIGTAYSEPYTYDLYPFIMGMSREEFFSEDHQVGAVVYDTFGNTAQSSYLPSFVTEPSPIHLDVWPNHHMYLYVDGPTGKLPAGSNINISARASEYEVVSVFSPDDNPMGFTEAEQPVQRVTFDPSNSGSTFYYGADYGYDFSYTWNVSGLGVGTYSIEVKAVAHDGGTRKTIRYLYIEAGEPTLDVSRVVNRIDNYFHVELTVENWGDASAQIDKIRDNVDLLQPIRKQDSQYEVMTESLYDDPAVVSNVEIDLFTDAGSDAVTLAPGESITVGYLAVPVLSAGSAEYSVGSRDVEVHYLDGSSESFDRPCSRISDGSTLSSAVESAKAVSDYLIVTNAGGLFAAFTQAEAGDVLSAMAELAQLKTGILGYVADGGKHTVHDSIKEWGRAMMGSDGVAGNYLSNGYLLLVGEAELMGSWNITIDGYDKVKYSDLIYANTAGEFRDPELIVGRIIGNSASDLIIPLQASINVYKGEPGFEWDRSHALVISGRGDGVSAFEDSVDEIADVLSGAGVSVTTLKKRPIEDGGGNIKAEIKTHDGNTDIVVFRDHGWPTSWSGVIGTGDFGGADPVDFEDSKPFAFGVCCYAGRYEDEDINDDGTPEGEDGIAEAFLKHGAAVYIGATQVSKRSENTEAAADFLDRWISSSDSIGQAFRKFKRNFNGTKGKRYWISEYNLYGDPKYGSRRTVAAAAFPLEAGAPEPRTSLDIVVPDYTVTKTGENEDYVKIPGGELIIEEGKPLVPSYAVQLDYPRGYSVQDVILTDRSGMTSATGLNIPVASMEAGSYTPMEFGEGDSTMPGVLSLDHDEPWWPKGVFDWEVRENADGTSTLRIRLYPFYYNPLTTDVEFYKNYSFAIEVISSTVQVQSLATGQNVYSRGDEVLISLRINNSGDAQDVMVNAAVISAGSDKAVDGFPLRTLKGLAGSASYTLAWDSSGFESGHYYVEVTLRDTFGNVLDRKAKMFTLGESGGEITRFTVTPQAFNIGDNVEISMDFSNTGSEEYTGAAVVNVQDTSGAVIEQFRSPVTGLMPGHSVTFNYSWDTSRVEDSFYRIVGYVLGDSQACAPAGVTLALDPNTDCGRENSGDVNLDCRVDLADAMVLIQYAAGWRELTNLQKKAGNITRHQDYHEVGIADVLEILRILAKSY
jgi:alpha-tubulin suppressor-like RCC1 family protein